MSELLIEHIPELALMGGLLGLSAFFSGSETALFSLTREELRDLERKGSSAGQAIVALRRRPRRLLAAVLLGNMAVNVLFFSVSYQIAAAMHRGSSAVAATVMGVGSLVVLIVCGEVAPKGVAVGRPMRLARLSALPLLVFSRVVRPITWALEAISRGIVGPITRGAGRESYVNPEELKMLIRMSEAQGVIDRDARSMLSEVVELSEIMVREVMVPRVDMVMFDVNDPREAFLDLVRRTRHKHIPVYDGSIDEVVGIVAACDAFLDRGSDLRELARPAAFVPETKTVESMLKQFREERRHLAIVVDEYGGTAGLITLEDIVEEVVGEIEDEFDTPAEPVRRIDDRTYSLAGNLGTRVWNDLFEMPLDSPEFDTVGGFVTSLLGHVPREGETAAYQGLTFFVEGVRRRRIERVRVHLPADANPGREGG